MRLSDGLDGITKEVLMLRDQRYLRKTVFIMPPEIVEVSPDNLFMRKVAKKSPEYRRTADGRYHFLNLGIVDYWYTAREHFSKQGVELPPFRESSFATFLSTKQVHEICKLASYLPVCGSSRMDDDTKLQAPSRMDESARNGRLGMARFTDNANLAIAFSHLLGLVNRS